MDLKWSKFAQYPNGSKNLYHNNRTRGRITIRLERGQTIEQYLQQHGRLPNWVPPVAPQEDPRIVAARAAAWKAHRNAAMAAAPTWGNTYKFTNIRRAFIELGKPWGMSKNSYESLIQKEHAHPERNFKKPRITVRTKNLDLFSAKLESEAMGWQKIVNGAKFKQFYKQFKPNGGGLRGILMSINGSNTNNFRRRTQIRNKIPVIMP
jgi:hypothetical protein